VQRRKLVVGNISFLKSIVIIYLLIFSFGFSMVTTSFITETVSADPNSYYVSTTGNNGNDGSFAHPWETIEYAVAHTSSGDTVNIMAGTYLPSSGNIVINGKSSETDWLTIRNYQNDIVLIDGTNCPFTNIWRGVIEFLNCKHVRVSGLIVNHSAVNGIVIYGGASTADQSFIRVDNCTISNSSTIIMLRLNIIMFIIILLIGHTLALDKK